MEWKVVEWVGCGVKPCSGWGSEGDRDTSCGLILVSSYGEIPARYRRAHGERRSADRYRPVSGRASVRLLAAAGSTRFAGIWRGWICRAELSCGAWRSGGDRAEIGWRSCGDRVEIGWRSGGDRVEIGRRSGGDRAEIGWRSGGNQIGPTVGALWSVGGSLQPSVVRSGVRVRRGTVEDPCMRCNCTIQSLCRRAPEECIR